jgi:hypothetical protein
VFAGGGAHLSGIEGFRGVEKTRPVKSRGVSHLTFYLHPKECEFRFDRRAEDPYQLLPKITGRLSPSGHDPKIIIDNAMHLA